MSQHVPIPSIHTHAWRLLIFMALPGLILLTLSLACTLPVTRLTSSYGERQRATDEAQRALAAANSSSVRATATAEAPVVQATATAFAEVALSEMPEELVPLYQRFGLLFVHVPVYIFQLPQPNSPLGPSTPRESVTPTPPQTQEYGDYWMSLTEVTNAQYRLFVEAGGYEDSSLWSAEGWKWRHEEGWAYSAPGCWQDPVYNAPNQPVTCVSWDEVTAYATWLSRESGLVVRLPTEAEWKHAARGGDRKKYPWGNSPPDSSRANYAGVYGAPAPVSIFPARASSYGIQDMAGNVWEWTTTLADPKAGPLIYDRGNVFYIVKGGSWYENENALPISFSTWVWPPKQMDTVGLRLVVTLD